jgi:hypothetical protein
MNKNNLLIFIYYWYRHISMTSVLTRVKSKNPLLDPFLNFCKKELIRTIIKLLILFKRSKVDLCYVKNLILHLECITRYSNSKIAKISQIS